MKCSKCNGSGNRAKWDQIPDYRCYLECDKCNGTGKLDWIENIVGIKNHKKGLSQQQECLTQYAIDNKEYYGIKRR